jgi:hypothetical protein
VSAPAPPITTVGDVKAWLGPGHDPAIVQEAYDAAESWVGARVSWYDPDDPTADAPESLAQAVCLQTQRLLARRNSPDGLVGMGDLGFARVPVTDADVQSLIAPWRVMVLG